MHVSPRSKTTTQSFSVAGLPIEIWKEIIAYISSINSPDLKSLISFGKTCKIFYNCCLENIEALQKPRLFSILPRLRLAEVESASSSTSFYSIPQGGVPRFLTIDAEGKQYFCNRASLFVIDFSDKAHFTLCVDLTEIIKEAEEIVACHPIKNGIILVTCWGILKWLYDEKNTLQLDASCFMYEELDIDRQIISSTLHNNNLVFYIYYLDGGYYRHMLLDLNAYKSEGTYENPMHLFNNIHNRLFIYGAGNHLLFCDHKEKPTHLQRMQITEGAVSSLDKIGDPIIVQGEIQPMTPQIRSDKWLLYQYMIGLSLYMQMIDCESGRAFSVKIGDNKFPRDGSFSYFLQQEVLFIFYNEGELRAIHLPTGEECNLGGVLAPYLEEGREVFSLSLTMDKGPRFHLLLLHLASDRIESVDVPLEIEPAKKMPEIKELPSEEPKTLVFLTTKPTPTVSKVITAIGAILFLLTAGASVALIALHPGLVVYQGSGMILTLPATLVISIGGPASLLVIAIGSFRWWKAQQHYNR